MVRGVEVVNGVLGPVAGETPLLLASRYDHAQSVCTPGFFDRLPPMASALDGLYLADTSHYYPEDRSISESLRIGEHLAGLALARTGARSPERAVA